VHIVEKERLRPGMVLGQDIYNFGHQIVIKNGTILSDSLIKKLAQFSVLRVMVEDERVMSETTVRFRRTVSSKKIQKSKEFIRFQREYEVEVQELRKTINDVVERNVKLDTDGLYYDVVRLLKNVSNSFNAFDMVQNLRHYDDSTYTHSMNVGLLSNVFGRWLGFPEEDEKTLTLAGILHDIGKTRMPLNIIQKPAKLNNEEFRIIKMHPQLGYEILEKNNLNYHVRNVALQHHERCDGSGYPKGVRAREIDYFAKVISIVDVYDAMTSPRVYRGPVCPFDVIEVFEREGLQKYDSECILIFLKKIAESYMNEEVRLSNGETGKIIFLDPMSLSRPTIMTEKGPVDLRQEPALHITEIL
jgi:putative nucleotidyltransferase with HDIG domain